MPNQSPMTAQAIMAQLTPETLIKLEEAARLQNRSQAEIIQEAVDGYLTAMSWFKAEIEPGRKDLREGRFITREEMEEKYRELGAV